MNILGHAYVATRAVKGKRRLLILGSLLPESSPFIEDNPLINEEVHEGGDIFLRFLKRNFPEKQDLALGVMAHSRKFGADSWGRKMEFYAGDKREYLLDKITEISGWSSLKFAEIRLHNFLWWGNDVWILKNYPDFVKKVKISLNKADTKNISELLSKCFNKNYLQTEKTVELLLKNIYRPNDLNTIAGLARIWQRQAAGLPEKDRVNPEKATTLFEEIYLMFENQWKDIMEKVVVDVRSNLENY